MYKNQTFINHVLLEGQELTEMTADQILNWGERNSVNRNKDIFPKLKKNSPQKRQH